MKLRGLLGVCGGFLSPLAEGRELKFAGPHRYNFKVRSPLAEGRELKCLAAGVGADFRRSPLAEGRELKFVYLADGGDKPCRPSRRGVN